MDSQYTNQSAPPFYESIVNGNAKFPKSKNMLYEENLEKMKNLSINEIPNNQKNVIKPRDYQKKIFEKAKNQNSIIYVETGKGKTFISIMLMAYHLGLDIEDPSNNKQKLDKNKKIIFFVCDTSLIEQQKKAISNTLGIEVGTIQGKKSKKSKSDYELFKKMWDSVNIFVAIPSIIYKILSVGFLKIFDISMMVFDECHHTNDDHPYNKIMSEFYFFYKKKLSNVNFPYPRIYGLTASPIKKGVRGSIEECVIKAMEKLSENLDSVIIIDPEMNNSNAKMIKPGESISQYMNDDCYIEVKSHIEMEEYKKVIMIVYNNCYIGLISMAFYSIKSKYPEFSEEKYIEQYQEYVKVRLKAHNLEEYNSFTEKYIDLYNFRKLSPVFRIFEQMQRQIFMILENLCLESLILYFNKLKDIYNKLYAQKLEEEENFKNSVKLNMLNHFEFNDNDNDNDNEVDEEDISKLDSSMIQDIRDKFLTIIKKLYEYKTKGNDYISDRLQNLYVQIDKLFKKDDKSKFIIFISNRIVAHFLHPELNKYLSKNNKNKKCKEIIGINKRKSDGGTMLTPSLTLKEMNEIIKQFNEDEFNILIGTSAIEEGLDIQSCNAVLTLVELRTPKSFIQIKGRARKSNSEFIIFTNSPKEGKLKIENFLKVGQKMNELFNNDILKDFRRPNFISKLEDFLYNFDNESHAKITLGNISVLYNEIIQQIKNCKIKFDVKNKIIKVKSTGKITEFEFNGCVSVSTDLKDIIKDFPYNLGNFNSKDEATKTCYFYVLTVLKSNNYLDHHLKFHPDKRF